MKPPAFAMGDVVVLVNPERVFKKGEEHIIHEVELDWESGSVSYSTDRGAWFDECEFELVRQADKKSMKALCKSQREEYE